MVLAAGARLGPYETIAPLGSGGMGEVYRARDTRLDRTVAIKVLPAEVAADPGRRQRFEREARIISQLNHPHICALYDVGQEDGIDYLVVEYLEGQTLAERLQKIGHVLSDPLHSGPRGSGLPVEQALEFAIQVADALDAAHRMGIVHRDLKPANVMLTRAGAKLLDFGIAKMPYPKADGADGLRLATSPAMPSTLTAEGAMLGTVQYMAPEQLEGRDADARSDIFSFGCLLFEMLTGRRAFEGETQASLIVAVLDREPPAVSTIQPLASPAIDRLVAKCLMKDPDRRWQTAADLEDELRWIAGTGAASVQGGESSTGPSAARVSHARRGWIAATICLAVALAGTLTWEIAARLAPPTGSSARAETRVDIVTPPTNDPASFATSPDGRQVVFVASGDGQPRLWLRSLDRATATPLAGTEGATQPFWSPDSKSIGFFAPGALKRIDVGGGLPQKLADVSAPRGGAWLADGVILFGPAQNNPLFRIPASGGPATPVTKLDPPRQVSHHFPHVLPGGRQFLFFANGTPDTTGIYVGSLDSPDTTFLTTADSAGQYVPPGWLLFNRQGTLLARRFDPRRGELSGDPVTVAAPVRFSRVTTGQGAFSASATGVIAYRAGNDERQLTWFDRAGKVLGTFGAADASLMGPMLSLDGRRAAVESVVQGNRDVWILDAVRRSRVTFDAGADRLPVWSPDGVRVAFDSDRKGVRNLYLKSLNGAGSDELLLESPLESIAGDWSRDGRFLIYYVGDPKTQGDLWVLPMQGQRKPFVFVNTVANERTAQFSPDGRWVVYQSNESGRYEIYVRPFPGPGGQWLVSTAGGIEARWSRDGRELYYVAPDGTLMAAPVAVKGGAFEPGTPVPLFRPGIWGGGVNVNNKQQYDVTTDGRFLINIATEDVNTAPIALIQNWTPPASD